MNITQDVVLIDQKIDDALSVISDRSKKRKCDYGDPNRELFIDVSRHYKVLVEGIGQKKHIDEIKKTDVIGIATMSRLTSYSKDFENF
ncbi:hypothetical protein FQA39_LY12060 [Lamprigera yunnana]|nr:hypothetical protein FQA39_LY12060 [Lamprigera yunnana]